MRNLVLALLFIAVSFAYASPALAQFSGRLGVKGVVSVSMDEKGKPSSATIAATDGKSYSVPKGELRKVADLNGKHVIAALHFDDDGPKKGQFTKIVSIRVDSAAEEKANASKNKDEDKKNKKN